ncbi:MAG: M3 family oligoendopeptidase [Candidatus Heimdallarchaeota archaeon]|nr:M3 family oligoendopeptidase [Candidatus Heimdallarchaeota archaeon]
MEWDLSVYYSGLADPQIKIDIGQISKDVSSLVTHNEGKLSTLDASQLSELIDQSESIYARVIDLLSFTELIISADQTNKDAIALHSKFNNHKTEWNKLLTPLELELGYTLKSKPELINQIPGREYYLSRIKTQTDHKLSESEEIMELDKNSSGIQEWEKLQGELVSTLKFPIEIDGEIKEFSWSEGNSLKSHKDHKVRKAAIKGLFGGLEKISDVIAFSLRNISTNHVTDSKKRSYKSYKGSSYYSSHLSEDIISTMFEVILENVDIFQDFLLMKAKLLGTDKLRGEDYDAPYPFSDDRKISWEQAKEIVTTGFHSFDPEFSKIVEEMFKNNRVDAKTRDGKAAGAFCAPFMTKKITSILMSYNETMDNVSTLAHEMGHAIHAEYIFKNQNTYNSEIGMPIAETASEFGSLLFNLKFLNDVENETQKKAILFNMVEHFMSLIFEVGSRTLFEQSLYEAIENKEYLSKERINELYWEARSKIFGDAIEWDPLQVYEWVWKPHYFIHNLRFYNYPYVFGEFSVLGMYPAYRENKTQFVENYKKFLSIGASQHPQEFMKDLFGFDLSSKEFWQAGMKELKSFVDECKKMVNNQ